MSFEISNTSSRIFYTSKGVLRHSNHLNTIFFISNVPYTLKHLESYFFVTHTYSNKAKTQSDTYNIQMHTWTPPMLWLSKAPTIERCSEPPMYELLKTHSLPVSNQIPSLFTCMNGPITYWNSINKNENTQAWTHTHKYMNIVWSKMVSCSPCFTFYCFFPPWFIQIIWNNSYPSSD